MNVLKVLYLIYKFRLLNGNWMHCSPVACTCRLHGFYLPANNWPRHFLRLVKHSLGDGKYSPSTIHKIPKVARISRL